MKELTENHKIWLAALRSGKYKQGQNSLNEDGCFCCLGVAAEIFKTTDTNVNCSADRTFYDGYSSTAPNYVVAALDLVCDLGETNRDEDEHGKFKPLAEMNDEGKTFDEIADIFEQNVAVFTR